VLNVGLLMAVPFWGHHYFADVIGGTAVAVGSVYVVKKWLTPQQVFVTAESPAMSS
jgi:membrane-associated phospholipid phosphatase